MLQFLRDLFDPLFNIMGFTLQTFHGWGAPWWLSIAMLTVVVRTFLFPLTIRQVKSMRKMQDLKPAMDELRKEHKDEPQMLQQEMMRLYRERGANPLGGCLPIFVQLPIFLVLYYTIREFDKLESFRTGGLLWFQDLTVYDPLYLLPVLYIATMMVSQEIALKNTAPEQKRIMRFLPLVFGIVLIRFPAGLFVYWVTSNVISIFQNLLIYRNAPKPGADEGEQETDAADGSAADSPAEDGYRAETNGGTIPPDRPAPNGSGGQQSEIGQRRRARRRR
jgi:YidC/Oxa1 family membrane protein insertase